VGGVVKIYEGVLTGCTVCVYVSICQCVCLSVCLSVYLSVCVCVVWCMAGLGCNAPWFVWYR